MNEAGHSDFAPTPENISEVEPVKNDIQPLIGDRVDFTQYGIHYRGQVVNIIAEQGVAYVAVVGMSDTVPVDLQCTEVTVLSKYAELSGRAQIVGLDQQYAGERDELRLDLDEARAEVINVVRINTRLSDEIDALYAEIQTLRVRAGDDNAARVLPWDKVTP